MDEANQPLMDPRTAFWADSPGRGAGLKAMGASRVEAEAPIASP